MCVGVTNSYIQPIVGLVGAMQVHCKVYVVGELPLHFVVATLWVDRVFPEPAADGIREVWVVP